MFTEDYDKIIEIANETAEESCAIGITEFLIVFEKRLRDMQADQKARTVSTDDTCAEPERILHYCDCRTHDPDDKSIITGEKDCRICGGKGTWEEVPVILVDGECDGQEYYVKVDADNFIATSGSDRNSERQKYGWDLDENDERKYHNDLRNPGTVSYTHLTLPTTPYV